MSKNRVFVIIYVHAASETFAGFNGDHVRADALLQRKMSHYEPLFIQQVQRLSKVYP